MSLLKVVEFIMFEDQVACLQVYVSVLCSLQHKLHETCQSSSLVSVVSLERPSQYEEIRPRGVC